MTDGDDLVSVYLLVFVLVLVLSLYIQHVLEAKKLRIIPEVGATILVGMLVKGLLILIGYISKSEGFKANSIGFSPKLFFLGMLPPIIFNSGYHLKRRLFYENFIGIMSLAIFGTIISIIITSFGLYYMFRQLGITFSFMECLSFAALISSTDPVTTLSVFSSLKVECNLFYLVFGESALNDAIAITIFKVANRFVSTEMTEEDILKCVCTFIVVFILSCIIGYGCGIISALLFRYSHLKNQLMLSVGIFLTTVYVPYLLSEALHLSGIVTILFTGISSRRYTNKNISREAKRYASFTFKLLSTLAETSCFAFLGLSVFSWPRAALKFNVISITLLLCYVSRCHVYLLLSLVNTYRWFRFKIRNDSTDKMQLMNKNGGNKYSLNTMHAVFYSGLRGAVAFACALIFPQSNGNRNLVICTTTVIILITIFVQGSLTETIVKFLGISCNVDPTSFLAELESGKDIKDYDFERRYLYPLIVGNDKLNQKVNKNIENDQQSSGGGSQRYYDENDDQSIDGKSIESSLTSNKKGAKVPSSNRDRKEFYQQLSPLTLELEEELYRLTRENLQGYDEENEADADNDLWDVGRR